MSEVRLPSEIERQMALRMAEHEYARAGKERRFPGGFKYHYFTVDKQPKKPMWKCCYSTVRNENGKFVSFVYAFNAKGNRAEAKKFREHKYRNKAKARALKLYSKRAGAIVPTLV